MVEMAKISNSEIGITVPPNVAQAFLPAVWRTSWSAFVKGASRVLKLAGLEARGTAGRETCATTYGS